MTTTTPAFPTDEARWSAVRRRDAAADGHFYYGVRTTGVCCKPSCPSRPARREHVSFHADLAAAIAAGFRPCKRCKPGEVDPRERVVAQVMRLLETREPAPTLAELGAAVGLGPTHLQKAFKRATGVSPRAYAAALKAERLRARLQAGDGVTTAQYEAGYGSSRALYAAAGQELGMTPGAFGRGGAGARIAWGAGESPFGPFVVAATARGVCALRFGEAEAVRQELAAEFPRAELVPDAAAVAPHVAAIATHLATHLATPGAQLALPLDVAATAFQRRVWDALRAIPPGETRTYQDVARMIGDPQAVRAVARACATNPVALAVPCHRVVRTDGRESGYRWGLPRKAALLAAEAAAARSG